MTQFSVVSTNTTTHPARLDDLTCARALFAAWVFAYHLNLQLLAASPFGPLSPFVARGYLGVDGFFILSGFVLAHTNPNLGLNVAEIRSFWWRRFLRLYPVHISVISLLAIAWLAGHAAGLTPRMPERFGLDELVRHLLLLHGWGFSDRWAWNYPSWSISTEWAGYLAFPVLLLGLRHLPEGAARLLPYLLLLGLLTLVERGGEGAHLNLSFAGAVPRFACEFLAGMALARARTPIPATLALLEAALALGAGLALHWDALAVFGLFLGLQAAITRHHAGAPSVLARIPGLVFLGTISYAFYMSFAVVEMLLAVSFRHLAWDPIAVPLPFALLATALTFALALFLHHAVERPAQRWR